MLNEWIPCPGKRKQIKKITVLPTVQAFGWESGGLEGDASALAIVPLRSGHCLVRGSPSKQGGRSPASQGCLVWRAPSHTLWQYWETSSLLNPDSLHWVSLRHLIYFNVPFITLTAFGYTCSVPPPNMFQTSQNIQVVVEAVPPKPSGQPGELGLHSCSRESLFIQLKTQNEN